MPKNNKLISIIIPVYNERDVVSVFMKQRLFPVLKKIDNYKFEIIVINDGSEDDTYDVLEKYAKTNKDFRVVNFSRNFGKEAALSAGFRYAQGEAVIAVDADGEQPPNLIPQLIRKWENGAQVVTVIRIRYGKHGVIKKFGSKIFYRLLHASGNNNTVSGSTDFRLLDRVVVDEFNKMTEHNRITRGLIDWMGFRTDTVKATFVDRIGGKPSYSVKKLIGLAVDSLISLSTTPLVIFGYIGGFITIGSLLLGIFIIIQQYILGDPLHLQWSGAVQMAVFISFLVGLVLISQAISALYISRIHNESKNRPLYIVDKKTSHNLKQK